MNLQIMEAAANICYDLKNAGFIIQRANARTSNSVYLKLDYGVGNSIRISDHNSRNERRKYKYSVGTHIKKFDVRIVSDQRECRNYPISEVDRVVKDAIRFKRERISKIGTKAYEEAMMEKVKEGKGKNAFWKVANLV